MKVKKLYDEIIERELNAKKEYAKRELQRLRAEVEKNQISVNLHNELLDTAKKKLADFEETKIEDIKLPQEVLWISRRNFYLRPDNRTISIRSCAEL